MPLLGRLSIRIKLVLLAGVPVVGALTLAAIDRADGGCAGSALPCVQRDERARPIRPSPRASLQRAS